jgi:hypothetical protein
MERGRGGVLVIPMTDRQIGRIGGSDEGAIKWINLK